MSTHSLVGGLRVLEASRTIAGAYAGKLLADVGARVTALEPSGGHPLRATPYPDEGPRAFFDYLMAGKELTGEGIETFAGGAFDIVILEDDDQVPAALVEAFRNSVVVTLTPWGQTGSWAGTARPWTEFTLQAESGGTASLGYPDRPPLATGGQEPLWVAASFAAGAALAASRQGRRGEVIDVSLLETAMYATNLFLDPRASILGASHDPVVQRARINPSVESAKDGWVGFNLATAQNLEDFMVLIEKPEWLADEELCSYEGRYARAAEFQAGVREWTERHTVAEIVDAAQTFRIPCAPVHNGETILQDDQTVARGFYRDMDGGRYKAPAAPFLFNGRRADEPSGAEAPEDLSTRPVVEGGGPLSGLTVVDLGTWWVGALSGSLLGSWGADVIKVESTRRVDGSRMMGGLSGMEGAWWERSAFFLGANHYKRAVTIDFTQAEGRELLVELIRRADVLLENFAPRVLESVGLDWEAVREINPKIIMVRMPAFGLTGPRRDMVGYAQTVEQYSGMCFRSGYADLEPLNPGGPPDPMGGANAVFAFMAALHATDRTGGGMLVEAPLSEAALVMTSEQVIEFSANQRLLDRDGNHHPGATPQGTYAVSGTEQWLALSVDSDERWRALKQLVGDPAWEDPGLATQAGRYGRRAQIDEVLVRWAADQELSGALTALIAAGIPAAAVYDPRFIHQHTQVVGRPFFEEIEHPEVGRINVPVLPYTVKSGRIPYRLTPPLVGEHNNEILEWLGVDTATRARLADTGIIGTRPLGL